MESIFTKCYTILNISMCGILYGFGCLITMFIVIIIYFMYFIFLGNS